MPNRVHLFAAGSAPHARGTPCRVMGRHPRIRFSPACAGNTPSRRASGPRIPVQPRMRGEHSDAMSLDVSDAGSAPHARGTRVQWQAVKHSHRFSPACAGNTKTAKMTKPCPTVQPRMRGEHPDGPRSVCKGGGSAPHARGTLSAPSAAATQRRFSPACAGNTGVERLASISATVQPRMRGEHSCTRSGLRAQHGSAPHARGTLAAVRAGVAVARFSPACAGNTQTKTR